MSKFHWWFINEELRAINSIIPEKQCVITSVTHFLFKMWEDNSKYNAQTLHCVKSVQIRSFFWSVYTDQKSSVFEHFSRGVNWFNVKKTVQCWEHNYIINIFIHAKISFVHSKTMPSAEEYPESCQRSKVLVFAKCLSLTALTAFAKSSILDVLHYFDYTSEMHYSDFPATKFMFKVNNRNIITRHEMCSKLTIKTTGRRHWRGSSVFIVNFKLISHLALLFLLLTLTRQMPTGFKMHYNVIK